jgi:hypothetical protein
MKAKYFRSYIIMFSICATTVFAPSIITHNALAFQQGINSTNMTSKTPIDVVNVIKKGEQSVNAQLDQARQAIQANNNSRALELIEEAKEGVNTLSVCATSVIQK